MNLPNLRTLVTRTLVFAIGVVLGLAIVGHACGCGGT